MTALDTPTQMLMVGREVSALGTKAATSAGKVRHSEVVPGSIDNDGDSWREHHEAGTTANREAIRQALARLDTLGNFIDEDGFTVATADQAEAGYAYEVREGAVPPNASLALVPANQSTTFAEAPTTTAAIYIRTPAGIDPITVRIDHRRGQTLVQSFPAANQGWNRFTAFTGRSPHYDYFELVDGNLGSTIGISGIEDGDRFDFRIHAEPASSIDVIEVIPDNQDTLPDAEDHSDTKLILWRGNFYRKREVGDGTNYAFSFRVAELGSGIRGVSFGRFEVNPNNNFGGFEDDTGELLLYIERGAYQAAAGGNIVLGQQLSVTLRTDEDTPRTQTLTMAYRGQSVSHQGRFYYLFTGSRVDTIMDAASVGRIITVALQRGGSAFMEAPTSHEGWIEVELAGVAINARAIRSLRADLETEEHHSEALRTEVQEVEHKTSRITTRRDESPWAATTNNADGLRLGKAFWLPTQQTDVAFLSGADWLLRSTATKATINEGDLHNFFGFIAKNDSTWRDIRAVIRDAANSVVAAYSPNNGRTANVMARRVPAALGDYTVRYFTNHDGTPVFIPEIGVGYTVTVEERTTTDVPVWEGELGDGIVTRDSLSAGLSVQLPELPAVGSRAGKSLKLAGDQVGWHPTFNKVEELASRNALTGGWTIPDVDRLGARNSITQSGTSLHIGAHSALLSGTYGVIVDVEMSLGTMSTFIPWSAFRTGSGTYVTGGGHGTQGIPVGYWNANNNSELVATADWASNNGRFELTIAGRARSGSATIRVWSAQ